MPPREQAPPPPDAPPREQTSPPPEADLAEETSSDEIEAEEWLPSEAEAAPGEGGADAEGDDVEPAAAAAEPEEGVARDEDGAEPEEEDAAPADALVFPEELDEHDSLAAAGAQPMDDESPLAWGGDADSGTDETTVPEEAAPLSDETAAPTAETASQEGDAALPSEEIEPAAAAPEELEVDEAVPPAEDVDTLLGEDGEQEAGPGEAPLEHAPLEEPVAEDQPMSPEEEALLLGQAPAAEPPATAVEPEEMPDDSAAGESDRAHPAAPPEPATQEDTPASANDGADSFRSRLRRMIRSANDRLAGTGGEASESGKRLAPHVRLFSYLMKLARNLPGARKREFDESDTRLQLAGVTNRLSGRRTLRERATESAVRARAASGERRSPDTRTRPPHPEDLPRTFEYLAGMSGHLADPELGAQLSRRARYLSERLREARERQQDDNS